MKRNAFGALMTLIVAFAIAVPVVQAQTIMKADVPFGFTVGSTYLPAGSYEIRQVGSRTEMIQSKDGHAKVLAMCGPAGPSKAVDETKLVFNKYGDRYVLAQIWTATSGEGLQAPKSNLEKELQSASNNGTGGEAKTVIVAMR